MPIYEYRCSACGFQKEFLQRLNDAPPTECLQCGKRTLKKLVTAAGFQLKGTGWYATDFKNSGAKPAAKKKAEEGSAKEASGKDTSSKDSSGKDTSSKDTSSKESSGKDASGKEASGKDASKSDSKAGSKTDTSPASS
jgi:putative FmdB family regulatory protein